MYLWFKTSESSLELVSNKNFVRTWLLKKLCRYLFFHHPRKLSFSAVYHDGMIVFDVDKISVQI